MLAEVLKVGYAEADSDNNSQRSYVAPSLSGPLWCTYSRTNRLRLEEQDEQPASQGERNRGNGIGIVTGIIGFGVTSLLDTFLLTAVAMAAMMTRPIPVITPIAYSS